jgi:hypothetical protein
VGTNAHNARLDELEATVLNRDMPLGVGLKNQCFVGLAVEQAQQYGETLREHFGKPLSIWKKAIKKNNATSPRMRNLVMLEHLKVLKD